MRTVKILFAAVLCASPLIGGGAALAQEGDSCSADFQKLAGRRVAQIAEINKLAKGGKAKVDPAVMCTRLRGVAATEGQLIAYVAKNKDWCGIPDEVGDNLKKGHGSTVAFANKACNAAASFRKQAAQQKAAQTQGAENPGAPQVPKLPAGPL